MTDPLSMPSKTPRYALALLFPGQFQKEFSVNAGHAVADILLHPAIEGVAAAPPAGALEGESWLVDANATGAFAGQSGKLASLQAGIWVFATPRDGLRMLDRSTGQHVLFAGGWRREDAPAVPDGGTTVDAEARAAIAALIAALRETGIFPQE
jgi:hypothetical protein